MRSHVLDGHYRVLVNVYQVEPLWWTARRNTLSELRPRIYLGLQML